MCQVGDKRRANSPFCNCPGFFFRDSPSSDSPLKIITAMLSNDVDLSNASAVLHVWAGFLSFFLFAASSGTTLAKAGALLEARGERKAGCQELSLACSCRSLLMSVCRLLGWDKSLPPSRKSYKKTRGGEWRGRLERVSTRVIGMLLLRVAEPARCPLPFSSAAGGWQGATSWRGKEQRLASWSVGKEG